MRRVLLQSTLGAALLALAIAPAQAMGFGRSVTSTTLGQSLDFFVELASDGDEELSRPCVFAEVRAGDSRLSPENVRATVEPGRAPGERRIRVTTRTAIDEPIVTVDVTVGCTAKMSRRFVAFVDPPMLRLASVEREELVPQRSPSQVQPLVEIVNAAARPRAASARRSAGAGARTTGATPSRAVGGTRLAGASQLQRSAGGEARVAAAPKRPRRELLAGTAPEPQRAGPRLRLEAALPVAAARVPPAVQTPAATAVSPALADVAAAAPLPSAAPADADEAALAAERSKIASLESALTTLRAESDQQRKTLAALQARLRGAEDARDANAWRGWLVAALLLFIVVAMAWSALRRRQRRRARWFEEQTRQLQRETAAAEATVKEAEPPGPRVSQPPSGWSPGPPSILPVTAPASIGGLEVTTVLAPQSHYGRQALHEASANTTLRPAGPAAAPLDELADIEQQAEFFAILGQDDAAVALLDGHLRQPAATSPLPYLHLLDIHRRRGQRGEFERARGDHGARFAAVATDWDAVSLPGQALEDHAQAIGRLQAVWPTPPEAMRMLERLLLRPSANDAAFDLDGYRDLLLLYAVARDLATPVEADDGSIDVYLPLDDAPTEPLRRDAVPTSLDMNISGWTEMPAEPLVIRRSAGRRGVG